MLGIKKGKIFDNNHQNNKKKTQQLTSFCGWDLDIKNNHNFCDMTRFIGEVFVSSSVFASGIEPFPLY
jgi:hypothetical protein